MKKLLSLSLFSLVTCLVIGQKKELTLESSITGGLSNVYSTAPSQLSWVPESSNLSFVDGNRLVSQPANSSDSNVIITLEELSSALNSELEEFPRFSWVLGNQIFLKVKRVYYLFDLEKRKSLHSFELPQTAAHISFNEGKTACAYINDSDLYITTSNGKTTQVTSDGGDGIVYGQSVHRNEFGITGGFFWSPDDKKLAFYRMDESMVTDYPLVDITSIPAKVENIKYPMAGQSSHHVRLGVYNLSGDPLVYMNTEGPKDQYLCSVGWTPDSKSVLIGLLNRDQNHLKLNRYNAQLGNIIKPILEEKSDKYVEPENAAWFNPNNPEEFIWMSERSGYQHLYLYDLEGNLKRSLTLDKWEAHKIIGFDATGNYLLVHGTGETKVKNKVDDESFNGMQRYTHLIDFELLGHVLLDSTKGTHTPVLSPNGEYAYEHFTSMATPYEINLYSTVGKKIRNLHTAESPLSEYTISKPEILALKSVDDQTLYTRLIKPSNFDPNKTYPVLVYVYGGPHAQLVTDRYLAGAPLWMYWFAEQGYIVATMDNRGSANRGLEFEQATFRNLGEVEMLDQHELVMYLKRQSYVDSERMAIHGWSFGGFMTINMLETYPETFKAGIAGGPVCDWSMYEVMYTERYMDTPETNEEGFEKANLVNKVDQLADDLLVIHGTVDNVVVWQHSQALLKSAVDSEIQLDYFVYPGHPHNVRGKDRVHLMRKVLHYAADRIGPGTK
jgi:dipeptidyl-peptidase-4